MDGNRVCGIILHPTSLPGPYGIGEIGAQARLWVDRLVDMGQSVWQILPFGPTSYGDSPYQCLSTFAGNPLWISLDDLVEDGLLARERVRALPEFPHDRVDFGVIIPARFAVLQTVCRAFSRRATVDMRADFEDFCTREAHWLNDYALYVAVKEAHGMRSWIEWPAPLARREEPALREARKRYQSSIRNVQIIQFLFDRQWRALRRYANDKGIRLIGDIPIFVAYDSADAWAHPGLFYLDESGHQTVVAGVPPDYFSATGQRWGNPLYRWERHLETGYAWWIQRMRKILEMVDTVRIDHFRAFEAYWEIPADEPTAIHGKWVEGPGGALFDALLEACGKLPIIAEDLGVITPEVEALRDAYAFPGMRVLQFAFGDDDPDHVYLPHTYIRNCVAYTGTHDNDTARGWWGADLQRIPPGRRAEIKQLRSRFLSYTHLNGDEVEWDMIQLACASCADTAIYPLQDVLGLGSGARMNVPGKQGGNWTWRFRWEQLTEAQMERLHAIARSTGRSH